MKMKIFTCTIVVGSMLGSIAFGQTLTISGSVCQCSKTQVTVQEGTHYWIVQRTTDTRSVSGGNEPNPAVGLRSTNASRRDATFVVSSGNVTSENLGHRHRYSAVAKTFKT